MQTVGLKVLKNNLSAYIRAVTAGETVVVTDRDKIVAELVPPRSTTGTTCAEIARADMIRRGVLTPAKHKINGPPPRVLEGSFNELMRELDADRADR